MSRKNKRFIISNSLKNVIKISGGTVAGQVVSIITLPIITRLYGAEVMGIWATILAVSLILQAVSDWGMSNSLMIEEDEEKVISSYSAITTLTLLTGVISTIIIFPFFVAIKGYSVYSAILYTLLTIVYAFTVKQVNTSYTLLNRNKKYNVLMKNPMINYTCVAVFAIILGNIGFKAYGYYVAIILGQLFTLIHMRRYLPRVFFNFNKTDYVWLFKKYKDFLIYQTQNNIMLQMRDQFPNLLVGALFGDTMLGYYSISMKILNMPVTFIGQAIGKVFYQTASEKKRNEESIGDFVQRNFIRALFLALVPIISLYAVGDIIAVLFFGTEYLIAGAMLRIIVFKMVVTFISTCMQGLEIVLRKQKYALVSTFVQTLLSSLAIYMGYYIFGNIYIAIIVMTIMYNIVQLIYYSKLFSVMKISPRKILFSISALWGITIIVGSLFRFLIKIGINNLQIDYLRWFVS